MAPPSHVPNGLGFLPWMSTLGETRRPQQGKRRPTASPSPKLSPKNPQAQMPGQEADPLTIKHLQCRVQLPHGSPSDGRRRAGCTRQPQSCVGRHPIRQDSTRRRARLHLSRNTATNRPQPPPSTQADAVADSDDLLPGLRPPIEGGSPSRQGTSRSPRPDVWPPRRQRSPLQAQTCRREHAAQDPRRQPHRVDPPLEHRIRRLYARLQ